MQKNNPRLQEDLKNFLTQIGVTFNSITFIPLGEESFAWKVVTEEQTIFLKYCSQERVLKNLHKINTLLLSLQSFDFIVPPVLLNGKTELPFKDGYIYAYPFIEGDVYTIGNEKFNSKLVKELTEIIGEIHMVPIETIDIPKEDFNYPYIDQFRKITSDIEKGRVVPEVSEKDLVKLEKVIQEFSRASKIYKENPPTMVLTHGDITGRNILLTKEGEIKLLDWDEAKIAPKEKDINFLYDNPTFNLKYYQSITNSEDFNPELIKYYSDVWALDSILVNTQRLQYYKVEYGSREYLLEDVIECLSNY